MSLPPAAEPGPRPIATRADFAAALHEAFETVACTPSRELWLSDEHFADWPLGERATIERLTRWASSDRRLVLIARSYEELARRHPRWVAWRVSWSHVVTCRTHTELTIDPWPTLFVAPGVVALRLIDRTQPRGWLSSRPGDLASAQEAFDAVSQRSVETFPASTLGL